jgi:transcriptional regulator with XRE-family HTH domain
VTIPNVNGLHKAIAQGITHRHSAMIGRELRFLRTEMGMTQAELALIVHREPLAISRWERGEVEIDSNAETLIRLHATDRLGLSHVPVSLRSPVGVYRRHRRRRSLSTDRTRQLSAEACSLNAGAPSRAPVTCACSTWTGVRLKKRQ